MFEFNNPIKKYKRTNHSVFSCQYHIIFCPKYRRRVLINDIEKRLKELLLAKQDDYSYTIVEMEVMPDHVHLLLDINPEVGINNIVGRIKGYTSNTLRKEFKELTTRLPCLWTKSKFISTVGSVCLETVKKYIEEQKNK
jgi:putative transposase